MKKCYLEIQVEMPTDEAEAMLDWMAENKYLLYFKNFNNQ